MPKCCTLFCLVDIKKRSFLNSCLFCLFVGLFFVCLFVCLIVFFVCQYITFVRCWVLKTKISKEEVRSVYNFIRIYFELILKCCEGLAKSSQHFKVI